MGLEQRLRKLEQQAESEEPVRVRLRWASEEPVGDGDVIVLRWPEEVTDEPEQPAG